MDDCISRQAVLEMGRRLAPTFEGSLLEQGVNSLPSVQPERKKGKWMFSVDEYFTYCSVCGQHDWRGYVPTTEEAAKWMPICPKCGALMEEGKPDE